MEEHGWELGDLFNDYLHGDGAHLEEHVLDDLFDILLGGDGAPFDEHGSAPLVTIPVAETSGLDVPQPVGSSALHSQVPPAAAGQLQEINLVNVQAPDAQQEQQEQQHDETHRDGHLLPPRFTSPQLMHQVGSFAGLGLSGSHLGQALILPNGHLAQTWLPDTVPQSAMTGPFAGGDSSFSVNRFTPPVTPANQATNAEPPKDGARGKGKDKKRRHCTDDEEEQERSTRRRISRFPRPTARSSTDGLVLSGSLSDGIHAENEDEESSQGSAPPHKVKKDGKRHVEDKPYRKRGYAILGLMKEKGNPKLMWRGTFAAAWQKRYPGVPLSDVLDISDPINRVRIDAVVRNTCERAKIRMGTKTRQGAFWGPSLEALLTGPNASKLFVRNNFLDVNLTTTTATLMSLENGLLGLIAEILGLEDYREIADADTMVDWYNRLIKKKHKKDDHDDHDEQGWSGQAMGQQAMGQATA